MINDRYQESWLKHLEFAQNVITRMAQNSYLLKGWTVTLVAATFALSLSVTSAWLLAIALLPVVAFSLLDAYYLQQERLFRHLYDHVRRNPEEVESFTLNPTPYKGQGRDKIKSIMKSSSIAPFYGPILLLVVLATVIRALTLA